MKIVLDNGAYAPVRAHSADAGFDLRSRDTVSIAPHDSATFDTGVHFEIPYGMVGFLKSKSGLNVKRSVVSEGVIDSGYTGSIIVKLYNHSDCDYSVNAGDKITQIVFLNIPDVSIEIVENLDNTERGSDGFGSTGR